MSKPMKSFYDFFCHFGATMIFYVNVCTVFCNINDNSGYNDGNDNDDDDGATNFNAKMKSLNCQNTTTTA